MSLLDKKVSEEVSENIAQPSEIVKGFDSAEQVISQGTQGIMNNIGDAATKMMDDLAPAGITALSAAGAGFSGFKLFDEILKDDEGFEL